MEFDTYNEFRYPERSWERIKDKIGWKDKIIMDVGCHYGWFLFSSLDNGAKEVIGVDLNGFHNTIEQKEFMKPFDFIKKEIKTKSLDSSKIHLIEGDWLKVKAQQVDIVLCMNVAHYFSNIQGGIKKIFEHAKEYVIFETNEATEHKDFRLVSEVPSHWNNRIIKIYKRKRMDVSKITIGVPIYNQNLKYFRKCLESIKNQTYQNFEVVILDDGSDNREEVEKITKEFGFRYIYQENAGIGAARKSIVDNASKGTEFITFLSSDDIWDKKFLEVMINVAKEKPNKILYSSNYHVDKEGKIIMKFVPPNFNSHEDFCISCWESAKRETMFVNFSCVFIPKKVFEKVQLDKDLRYCEDLDFLLKSMKHFEYHLINQPLLYYRAVDNTTSRIMDKIPEINKKIRKKCREYWKSGK